MIDFHASDITYESLTYLTTSVCVSSNLCKIAKLLLLFWYFFIIFPGFKQLKLTRFLAVHAASDNKVAEIRSRIGEAKAPAMPEGLEGLVVGWKSFT